MHRIDGEAHDGNTFTDGDPLVPTPATVITADWLNAVQEEIANAIEDLGGTLSKPDNTQLVTRLLAVFGRLAVANTWTAKNTFNVDGDGWQNLSFNTGWGNDVGTIVPCQYRIDSFGRCWLRGEAVRSSGTSPHIGTLPVGARPPLTRGWQSIAQTNTVAGYAALQISGVGAGSPGQIIVIDSSATSVSLHGVCFYIDGM